MIMLYKKIFDCVRKWISLKNLISRSIGLGDVVDDVPMLCHVPGPMPQYLWVIVMPETRVRARDEVKRIRYDCGGSQ